MGDNISYTNATPTLHPRYEDKGSLAHITFFNMQDILNPPYLVKHGEYLKVEMGFTSPCDIASLIMETYVVINGIRVPCGPKTDMGLYLTLPIRQGDSRRFLIQLPMTIPMRGEMELLINIQDQQRRDIINIAALIEVL